MMKPLWAWWLLAPLQTTPLPSRCPDDMVLVRGTHHEEVQRVCNQYRHPRCWSFVPGLVMTEPRDTLVNVCMDRYEWPNEKGQNPGVMYRYVEAEALCAEKGKRMCGEFEWELACEGAEHRPWPYGWRHQKDACNSDKLYRAYDDQKLVSNDRAVREQEVRRLWQGAASGSHPACVSPFGVFDLVGNVEEWVRNDRPEWPYKSGLKGGYWSKAWQGCRGTNESHDVQFRFYEIGFRCCADPR